MSAPSRRTVLKATLGAAAALSIPMSAAGKETSSESLKGSKPMTNETRFTPSNSMIMLVDHQTGTVDWVKSLPKETVVASCRVLTRMATAYQMPLVLTTTMEEYVGPTIKDIQELAPDAFAKRYKRGGQLSCWDDAHLKEGAAKLGRKKIVLAGLTTDICLFWAASGAIKLGYEVLVVADACGTMTALGDTLTYDRLRGLGAIVTVANQAVTELVNNFGTPEGQKAQQIMNDEIISKLSK